jgi:hypothetical protein
VPVTYIKKIITSLVVFAFLLVLAIALVPTIINTDWGQQQMLSIVNSRIPGKMNFTDIHLSWFGSQKVKGLILKDPKGQHVISIEKIFTETSLWKLLTHEIDLSGLEIQELNGHVLLSPSGYTTLQEALLIDLPPKTLSLVPSQVPLAITHVNAKFGQLSLQKPFSMHLQGQTEQGSLKGFIEVDILLNETENSRIKAKMTGFPVDIFDDIISLNKPELGGIFHELLGNQLNLSIDGTLSHQGHLFDLTLSTANMEGAFKGMVTDNEIRLTQPGSIKMKATPELFDQIIAYAATSTMPMALQRTTELNVQVEDLTWPLRAQVGKEQASLKAALQMTPTHLTMAENDLLSFDLLDFRLDITHEGKLDIAASGNYQGEAFGGQVSFLTSTPHSPFQKIQGQLLISSSPVESIPLLGKIAQFKANFSGGLREANTLHIDQFVADVRGESVDSLRVYIDPMKLNLKELTLSKLNLNGMIQIDHANLPEDVSIANLQMPWEFNPEANRIKMNLAGSITKGDHAASPLKGNVLIENWLKEGKFDAADIKVSSDIKVKQVPSYLFNSLSSSLNIEDLAGEVLDLSLRGSFDLGTQIPGALDVAIESPNLKLHGTISIENGALQVNENQSLNITWNLTPKNWSYLRKILLTAPSDYERLRLNEDTPITLQINSLYIPFKQTNALIDNGLQAKLSVKRINLTDKKTNEVISINDLQANIETQKQTDEILFSLTADPTIHADKGQTKISLSGEARNLFDRSGKFTINRLSCEMKADCKEVSVGLVAALFALEEGTQARLRALIGNLLNTTADINIQQMTGLVKANMYGELGRAQLDGQVKQGFLTLNKPLTFQVKVTPQLGQTIINDFIPILSSAISSSEHIKIHIDPRGFWLPLSNFNIQQTQIPNMTLSLGKINFLNQGELKTILNLLKAGNREQMSVWFTPLYVGLQDGVIYCQRMDMLIGDEYPIAIWGKVDLNNDRVKMTVGVGEPALRRAFGLRGLDKQYLMQLPLAGTTGNVHIDQAKAVTYIGALVAQMHQVPAGELLGTVFQIAGNGFSDPTPPEPITKPLPWEGQFDDKSAKDSKNPVKTIPKAANDVIKGVEKGASNLLRNFFK